MRCTVPAALVCALMCALAACGGSDNRMSAAARAGLAPLVQQVRRAAGSRDRQSAQRTLAELHQAVGLYEKNGDISPSRAAQILTAANGVANRLALIPTTTTTRTTTTTTTTTPAPGGGRGHGDKHKGGGSAGND
jgi:hypothetical protein